MIETNTELLKKVSLVASLQEGLDIIDQLEYELKNNNNGNENIQEKGIGLAAIQIGINKRVCIIRINEEEKYNFINPRIEYWKEPIKVQEGCLSFPGCMVLTNRFNEIKVKDLLHQNGLVLKGLVAICVQHEIDHLDGIVMFDRIVLDHNGL